MVAMRRQKVQYKYIPYDILFEIRSRLPIKDFFKYRCVCKCWKPLPEYQRNKIQNLPLCGLILKDSYFQLATNDNSHITYVSMGNKDIIIIKTKTSADKLMTISSGFDSGSLRDLSFEFGSLSSLCQGEFFTIHRGLILVGKNDFTFHVHNPATKQVLALPISPFVRHGIESSPALNKTGFIINVCPVQVHVCFTFIVVRISPFQAEIYYSESRKWMVFNLININVSDDLLSIAKWSYENYVFIVETQTLFFLTNMEQGLAVGFDGVKHAQSTGDVGVYNFPLPGVVKGGYRNARLGESQECVYLSYHDDNGGVWFWKRDGDRPAAADVDTWVLLLRFGKTAKLSRSLELNHNHLYNIVKAGSTVIPIGFHPNFAIAFLYIKSCIFAYDLTNKTLEKIAELNNEEYKTSTVILPYIPFLVPLETSMEYKYWKSGKASAEVKFYGAD